MKTIPELQRAAYQNAVNKGWHRKRRSHGEFIALMHSELSEALEEIRNGRGVCQVYYNPESKDPNKPEGVPIELADVVIRIFDFCELHGIDLESAILEKMAFNTTRLERHGGKVL